LPSEPQIPNGSGWFAGNSFYDFFIKGWGMANSDYFTMRIRFSFFSPLPQFELLCRFGKMVFTNIPEDLVGVPFPSDAVYNIIRTRQVCSQLCRIYSQQDV
jgi:hypothetical protein